MSPEQARGKTVNKRTDIWAFGVVVYEMLTGVRLFEGETVSDTIAAVLTKQLDWSRVPRQAQRLLERCLERDPKQRLRDIVRPGFFLKMLCLLSRDEVQAGSDGSSPRYCPSRWQLLYGYSGRETLSLRCFGSMSISGQNSPVPQ